MRNTPTAVLWMIANVAMYIDRSKKMKISYGNKFGVAEIE